MSRLEPRQIYNDFLIGKIDKSSIIGYFISCIEKSNEETLRIEAIKFLSKLGLQSDFYFKFMENLLISDDNNVIKAYATKSLIKNFPNRSYRPIHWALENAKWESITNNQKIGLCSILKDLRNNNHPKLNSLLSLKEHVVFNDEIFLVNNNILNLNNLGIINIKKIEGLEKLTNLNELYLSGNNIYEIKGLENLTKLKILDLSHNKIKKIQGFDSLLDLQQLYLNDNEINNINGLDNLINLEYLNLDTDKILEIKGLNHNEKLHTLYLSHNNITEIKNLKSLINLFLFALNNNKIKEIKGLDNLKNLTILRLTNNEITEIKGLNNLKKLTTLNLANNKIKYITEPNLPHLYFINLAHNQIPKQKFIHFYKTHSVFKYFMFAK